MKILLVFIAALLLIVGTAATTVNIMTVKPAQPISTIAFMSDNPSDYILHYCKKGYILKTMTSNGSSGTSRVFVVMEKY